MKVDSVALEQVCAKLDAPLENARARWNERRGLLLSLVGSDGTTGQGEASPLHGFSSETFDDVEQTLRSLAWSQIDLTLAPAAFRARVSGWLPEGPASARAAAECALHDLYARTRRVPLWSLLADGPEAPAPVALCQLLPAGAAGHAARDAGLRGFASFKLKLSTNLARDLQGARAVRDALAPQAQLRLDANGCWQSPLLAEQLDELAALRPEFVEEAGAAAAGLVERGVRLALDESLVDVTAATLPQLLKRRAASIVVLKPALLGGLERCRLLAQAARDTGAEVVISHLWDGPVSWAAAAALALVLPHRRYAAGLAPHGGLQAWPRVSLPGLESGHIKAWRAPGLALEVHPCPST